MPNNELIERPKLNFFQRIRKMFLLRKINEEKYKNAPEYLQIDPEVINSLITHLPDSIQLVREDIALQFLNEHPDLIKDLSRDLQSDYLSKNPSLAAYLDDFQKIDFIFRDQKYDFIKFLSKEQQLELLITNTKLLIKTIDGHNIKGKNGGITFYSYGLGSGILETTPVFFADKLQYFDEEVLFQTIIMHKQILDREKGNSNSKPNPSKDFYDKLEISNLPISTQLKLTLLDDRLIEKLSDEAVFKYVNNNPLLLDKLPNEKKRLLINQNPNFQIMLPSQVRRLFVPKGTDYISRYSERNFNYNRYPNLDYDEVLKTATLGINDYLDLAFITDSVKDKDLLWEVSKSIPQALSCRGIYEDTLALSEKLRYVFDLFDQKLQNPDILNAIKSSKSFLRPDVIENNNAVNICKVLTDEKLLAVVDQEKIIEFIKEPTMELMKELIIETYGENAKKILDSRPGLTMDNIPNLRIFDSSIFENFGEATIHNQLTYETKFSILLADFANHPEKIAEYKKFERFTDGLFISNAAGNEEKFKSFIEFSDLIKSIDEKDMTPERIKALKLALSDRKMPETKFIPLKNIEDLDNYISARNKMYDEAMQKITDINTIRELISKRFFGMSYDPKDSEKYYRASDLSLTGMIQYYSIDNLLADKRTHESDLFNEDELDAIELASIISKVRDANVLKELYSALSSRESVIGPVEFEAIKQKIPMQYSRELVSQLLKPEDAIRRAESGEDGISVEHGDDGVDVIKLYGADFKIMVHTMLESGGRTNSGIPLPKNVPRSVIWKYYEGGCSTISNCLIEPAVLKSCVTPGYVSFGFANIDPRLVIGMSHHDAHVTHMRRHPNPVFQSSTMNYPEELLRRTAEQITGQDEEKDTFHEYNEVTTYRFDQNPENITSENKGGRILPDYIIVYGKSTNYHRKLAKALAKNGKPIPIIEIDVNAYERKKNMYWRAQEYDEEHKVKQKEDSKFIQDVKKITNKEHLEDR